MVILKTKEEIEIIRKNARILTQALDLLSKNVRAGVKTKELDKLVEDFIKSNGGYPSFKGYQGFPSSLCVSINEEVVHGIPGDRVIEEGQIVSVDLGIFKDGYHADTAFTFIVGKVPAGVTNLVLSTQQSLYEGLGYFRDDCHLSDISFAIQSYLEQNKLSVIRDFVGHGIGRDLHEDPPVPNFGFPGEGITLMEGMVLAIEPMAAIGSPETKREKGKWTVVTKDGSLAAHFEHTIALTERGIEILTYWTPS